MKDRFLGGISIIISLILLYTIREKGFSTKAFPSALLIILIILGVVLIIKKEQKKYDFSKFNIVILYLVILFLYIILLPIIGFIISTTLFIAIFLLVNKHTWHKVTVLAFSIFTSVLLWIVFSNLFGIRLPGMMF